MKKSFLPNLGHILNINGSLFIDPYIGQLVGKGGKGFKILRRIRGSDPDKIFIIFNLFQLFLDFPQFLMSLFALIINLSLISNLLRHM